MEVFSKQITLTNKDTKTNVAFPFVLDREYAELIIHFEYDPAFSSDETARKQVQEAIDQYVLEEESPEAFNVNTYLPVENLITVSLSKNGQYLGGHHNKAKSQTIRINKEKAGLGFWPAKIDTADWEVQLNCHCIASKELDVSLTVEVKK